MSNILDLIKVVLSLYGVWILIGLGTVLGLYALSKFRSAIDEVEFTLQKVKSLLREQLGDKASAVIDVWLTGLNSVKDGVFTEDEMVQEFIRVIKIKSSLESLSEKEDLAIEKAAQMTVQSISKKKVNVIAFQILTKK